MVSGEPSSRPAVAGELCTCGRDALVVYVGGRHGPVGHCGFDDGGLPASGVCTFCADRVDHDHYWDREHEAGRAAVGGSGTGAQGAPCPLYRLRLTGPAPELPARSVRPFDPDATYTLMPRAPGQPGDTGDLEEVAFDLVGFVRHALDRDRHDTAGGDRHPDAGKEAVAVLFTLLRDRLDELGADPNPLAGWLDVAALIPRAGRPQVWADTVAHDRPLLIARLARRALDPDVPDDIYRTWST